MIINECAVPGLVSHGVESSNQRRRLWSRARDAARDAGRFYFVSAAIKSASKSTFRDYKQYSST